MMASSRHCDRVHKKACYLTNTLSLCILITSCLFSFSFRCIYCHGHARVTLWIHVVFVAVNFCRHKLQCQIMLNFKFDWILNNFEKHDDKMTFHSDFCCICVRNSHKSTQRCPFVKGDKGSTSYSTQHAAANKEMVPLLDAITMSGVVVVESSELFDHNDYINNGSQSIPTNCRHSE